ncbi:HAMP domain-containing sensor histidine kinase [Salibacterium qingdaonense]|uniref:histidine kinase n=1 Tax=Salibacterium qingdaonense TaxID=266892 RepID=A0A1I4LV90_9BACI|nr:ATP-binding protein [Salibacterium qingdaonense]SFL94910.1 Signal transduction histidine kinase [Salibacterium qingdaonense]
MKKGIVLKLFLLTALLCMLILATIYIGQTVFFKQYYATQEVDDIKTSIESFKKEFLKAGENVQAMKRLEQDFYQEHSTWITTLDSAGNMKHTNDFSVTIHSDASQNKNLANRDITIPLYSFIGLEDLERIKFDLEQGKRITIDGILADNTVIPAILTRQNGNFGLENKLLTEELYGNSTETDPLGARDSQVYLTGNIKKLQLPVGTVRSPIYTNRVFIEQIKQFQAKLLFNDNYNDRAKTMDYEKNGIEYKIFIRPMKDANGETAYIFAMTSLQPIDEAVQMLEDYYIYLIILALLLIVLASFYFSKKIAKPLLQINDTTSRMANLDFSETIPVKSKDEIGTLSHNINSLSTTLHSHINQLQEDIEKEKQLEHTRKEFISGVSHELKTPLSILKSCISILEDDVAKDKKDYYFNAMANEVDKMDMLIVEMLELAKFESGTYKMEMDVFYIDQVIEYICEQLSLDIADKQLHVHKHLSGTRVVANQHRIEQVVTNFITNAIRHTPEDKNIIISTKSEQELVKVCVENNGSPIAEEHVEKIWDRFYRGDTSRDRSEGSMGLGLAISKNILELHGVQYGVTNTEEGVLFYFYLNKKE